LYEEILLYHYPDFKKEYEAKIAKKINPIAHILKNENSKIVQFLAWLLPSFLA